MTITDVRHVLRRLLRAPGFSLTSVLLLGLAFGALACVISVVYGLLYKPLPYPQAERLVSVETRMTGMQFNIGMSVPLLDSVARHALTLDGVAAYRTSELPLHDDSGQRTGTLVIARVEPALFDLLGAQPALGRMLAAEDAAQGAPRQIVISWDEWQQRYTGAADTIGRRIQLGDEDWRIVGVAPRGFAFPSRDTRAWLPLGFSREERTISNAGSFDGLLVLARMQAGTNVLAISSEVNGLAVVIPELAESFGKDGYLRVEFKPLRSIWIGERQSALLLMLLAVAMVWLVTAANVANLFLARALARRHESALIGALGAAPWRCRRTAALEAALLCGAGALLGCALLPAGLTLLQHFDLLPQGTPQAIGIDAPTLALIAVLATALCAVLTVASLSAQRGNLHDMIRRGGSRQTLSGSAQTARKGLMVTQMALTVALLFGIGVLLRSSHNLLTEDIGFARDNLLYMGVNDIAPWNASEELRRTRLTTLIERARALPGVAHAGLGSMVPFGGNSSSSNFVLAGQENVTPQPVGYLQDVDHGYFPTLGISILRGRTFTEEEVRTRAPVAIIDQLFVQRHFANTDPIGQRVTSNGVANEAARELIIVGVVRTLKQRALDETADRVSIYRPNPAPDHAALVLRTSVAPEALAAPLKKLAAEIAPDGSIGAFVSMDERIADTLRERTRLNTLLGLLGVIALLLAAIGLYAVLAYAVRLRVPEFGVRMALGARATTVQREVLAQGLRLIGAGLLLGLPLAWTFARLLADKLYGTGTFDLHTLAAVAATVSVIGVAACWLPALRASRVDPVIALRNE